MKRLHSRLRSSASQLSPDGFAPASLALDFLGTSNTLDNRVTFSRGSQATLTDSTGKLTYAPNNLLTNSESFEASAWSKTRSSITSNAAVAPDGTTTADKLVEDTSTNSHFVSQSVSSFPGGSYVIVSIYAKASGRNFLAFVTQDSSGAFKTSYFDVSNGTIGTVAAGHTASIQNAGNGWYRCIIVTSQAPTTGSFIFYPGLSNANGSSNYTGDGTSGLFIWGAQLEQVTYQTTPGTYNSTTPKNLLGYTQEFDNAAWVKSNVFVQTNLLTYSEQFDNAAWLPGAVTTVTVTADATTSPDGTADADKLIIANGVSSGTTAYLYTNISKSAVATTYTFSCYAKEAEYDLFRLVINDNAVSANFALGAWSLVDGSVNEVPSVGGTFTNASGTATAVGNGWYRITLTFTSSTETVLRVRIYPRDSSGVVVGDGTSGIYVWGAQLVQGATAGDYQPTYASAAAVQYTAPDGSRTADKLVEDAISAAHRIRSAVITLASGATTTVSAYIKAGERTWALITDAGVTNSGAYVNLATGQFGTINGGVTRSSIENAGGGWYRVSISGALAATTSQIQILTATADGTSSYAGDGTSGIYIWGAQLSNSASVDPYSYNPGAAPTSTAYYGPRFDYDPVTLQQKGLLIEEQRTNLLTYSEDLATASSLISLTVTTNTTIAPDGTLSGDTLTPSVTSSVLSRSVVFTGDGDKSISVFLKAGTSTSTVFFLRDTTASVTRGVVTLTWSSGVPSGVATVGTLQGIDNCGNGWYRIRLLCTGVVAANINQFRIQPDNLNGTNTVIAWGTQAENGSFATSYIPTVASTVTRSADVATMTGANFSSWYNQSEGTFNVSYSILNSTFTAVKPITVASDGTTSNRIYSYLSTATPAVLVTTGGSAQATVTSTAISADTVNKIAFAFKVDDIASSSNGASVGTDNSASIPTVNQLSIGIFLPTSSLLNGHIRSISYYPQRLPDYQLQRLTA